MASLSDYLRDEKAVIAAAITVGVVVLGAVYISLSRKPKQKVALNPEEFVKLELVEKESLSHNVRRFKFALQTPDTVLGLPIGQHVGIKGVDEEGKEFMRPYTPTTLDTDVGHLELVIKVYPQGAMSQYMDKLVVGGMLPFKGPKGRFQYTPNMVRAFGMVAGGTGITPMYQVARAILENPEDKTNIHLISANITEGDILLKKEMDAMAARHPKRFQVYYVLNEPPTGWTGGIGFVTADMIKSHCPPPAGDIKMLRCGPPAMNKAMAAHMDALGYSKDMQFQF
eukprot:jgi/Mesen1/4684/ME000241S03726